MVDLVMMQCAKVGATLSTVGCGRRFLAAQREKLSAWSVPNPCRGCPVGAGHAGCRPEPMATVTEAIRHICPRCRRVSPRMIRGELCVSCYNRHREVDVGANAKGTRPTLTDRLHTQRVCVVVGGAATVRTAARVTSRVEVMLAVARAATAPLAFGRPRLEFCP